MLNLVAGLAASFISAQALSQSLNFEGFSAQISTGYQELLIQPRDVRVHNTNFEVNGTDTRTGTVPLVLGLGYTASIGSSSTLGGQLDYDPVANRVSISMVPGYAFTDSTQGYVKLGWSYQSTTFGQGASGLTASATLNGPFGGLGARVLITQNFYGFAELNYIQYLSTSVSAQRNAVALDAHASPRLYNVLVGLGYKF